MILGSLGLTGSRLILLRRLPVYTRRASEPRSGFGCGTARSAVDPPRRRRYTRRDRDALTLTHSQRERGQESILARPCLARGWKSFPLPRGEGGQGVRFVFRIGVLVSGGGTNLQAILDAVEAGSLPVEVAVVISNRPDAYALERARRSGVPTVVVPLADYPGRKSHEAAVARVLESARVDLVVLAGYDRIARHAVLAAYSGRIVNIHPALLPAFAGTLHAQEEALAYGVKITGCTVHFVTEEVDCGPIVVQRAVEVREDDTVDRLKARILAEEHKALPEAIRLIASGRTRIEGRRVVISPQS